MNLFKYKFICTILITISLASCIKNYDPPAIQNANNNYLVVDGFINAGPNQSSTFVLSRTRNLGDSNSINLPELNATLYIVSKFNGSIFPLIDSSNTGSYSSQGLNLTTSDQYQLKIKTTNGEAYFSDFVPVKISAPIDSVTWNQINNINIYVNTHDPTNKSIYYKWDFVETWEHDATITSFYMVINGNQLILSAEATASQQIDSCWSSKRSSSIITGTSAALSQDVINQQPITTILQNDTMLGIRFSILVRQIPLTAAAFNYWTLIEKNSQQLGTFFDPQPSQLPSNIHSTSNPNEPVIGYVSAAFPQEKRLFINANQVTNWNAPPPLNVMASCPLAYTPDLNYPAYTYPDSTYAPITSGGGTLTLTKKQCVDCVFQGGTTTRPSFW